MAETVEGRASYPGDIFRGGISGAKERAIKALGEDWTCPKCELAGIAKDSPCPNCKN